MKELIEQIRKSKPEVPKWENLSKEYDTEKHKVKTDTNILKDIERDGGQIEKSARITYGYQKLATKRMTQMAFAIPVQRNYETGDDEVKIAQAKAIEEVYKRSRIDSVNIRRMRAYFASCEIATMWFPVKSKNNHYGFESEYKLRCITYSPMEERFSNLSEAEIYPVFDKHDDLVKLAFEIKVKEDEEVVYFYIYEADKIQIFKQVKGQWEEVDEVTELPINKIPGVYLSRSMPIWENLTSNVHEIELALSRESNILRKNSAPILGVTGKLVGNKPAGEVAREVYQFENEGKIEYITWQQQIDAFKFFIETMKKNMDEELQLPNLSMDNVKDLGQIGEGARKTILTDAHLKVGDESGTIIEFLERECNVIKSYLGQMNKEWEKSIDDLKVEHVITPFIQNDEMAEIEKITKLTQRPLLSTKSAMKRLGIENPEEEYNSLLEELEQENRTNVFETAF